MEGYQIKPGKIGAKVIGAYGKIEKKFTDAFLEADESSESGYRLKTGKAGDAAVDAYKKSNKVYQVHINPWKMRLLRHSLRRRRNPNEAV